MPRTPKLCESLERCSAPWSVHPTQLLQRQWELTQYGKAHIGWKDEMTYLCLAAASEDGFNRWKGIYKLFDFHTVPKNHGCVTCWSCHDNARAVQKLDVFVQMHLLKAPKNHTHTHTLSKTRRRKKNKQGSNLLDTYLVTPGVAPTLHARARFRLLIKLLFPTLGKPIKKKQQWQKCFYAINKTKIQVFYWI